MNPAISRLQLVQYSVLALPLAFAGLPIYLLAPDFYATSYQIPLTWIGIGLLILRLLDAFIDPLLGYLIDCKAQQFKQLIRLGVACMAVGVFMLFWVPEAAQTVVLAWFCLAVFVTTLAYSLLTIGYGVQGAIWSAVREDQVRITTTREGFTLIGLIMAVTLPSILSSYLSAVDSYRALAVILVVCLILAYAVYAKVKTPQLENKHLPRPEPRLALRALMSPVLIKLYLIYGISVLASAIPAVLVIFFVRDYLQAYELIGVFLLLYFFSGALSMPVWRKLSNRLDKVQAWMISMFLAICSFALVLMCQPEDHLLYAGICLVSGFALGAELALPPAILAELVDKDIRSVGLKFAGLTCLNKLSLAFAAGISLPLLGLLGFQPGQVNSEEAQMVLLWTYGALPCLLKSGALISAFFWKKHSYEGSHV